VRVWAVPESSWPAPEEQLSVLDADERARMARFHRPSDRAAYLAAHALLRTALTYCRPDIAPADWEFAANRWGRPQLAGSCAITGLRFSISRRHAMVACAISEGPACGVDVEYVRRSSDMDALARTVLAPAELADYTGRPPGERTALFYRLWTLKEAYTKAVGKGLHIPFDECVFADGSGALRPALLSSPGLPPGGGASWWLEQWPADRDHLVALAVHRGRSVPPPTVRRPAAPWHLLGGVFPSTVHEERSDHYAAV
jgi:4'-phosphopantetheinyl transferase